MRTILLASASSWKVLGSTLELNSAGVVNCVPCWIFDLYLLSCTTVALLLFTVHIILELFLVGNWEGKQDSVAQLGCKSLQSIWDNSLQALLTIHEIFIPGMALR